MSAYKRVADLSDAVDEFLLGDAHAKNHLAQPILDSMRSMPAIGDIRALRSQDGHGVVIDLGDGRLVALRHDDWAGRN